MELKLISNEFYKNTAINGGALYIQNREDIDNNDDDRRIILQDNIFKENFAENFGGGIYAKFSKLHLVDAINNKITFNKAGIMGAGIYTSHFSSKFSNNTQDFIFTNNTINSSINDYSSKPSYISLDTKLSKNPINIITGDYFPLSFTMYDEYDNIINDVTKYYSNIMLKVSIQSKIANINHKNNTLNTKISGNISSFINGKFDLTSLQIYANPDIYTLIITIENYNEDIKLYFDQIEIQVNSCNSNQIKMYDDNSILYCVNPICKPSCPVDESASCEPYYLSYINDINKNICQCFPGYDGIDCREKILIDYRYVLYYIKYYIYTKYIYIYIYFFLIPTT
jgi:hypothetical protein